MLLDSSVLVAFYNERDSLHEKSEKLLHGLEREHEKAAVPLPVLFETASVLKKLGATQEATAGYCLHLLKTFESCQPSPETVEKTIGRFKRQRNLSLTDCCIIELALESSASVASFDENLVKNLKK